MQEQDIPIDIHTNKLLDWFISRRHCNKDWSKQVLIIREKINNAIQDMPVHEGIAKLLSGTYINYFHCIKIIEILKETEADTKNFFGSYGSKRMKDWQEIVKLYEKDNIYLAEAAQMLIRNVTYEIPAIKKQIVKFDQMQKECDKKETDYLKTENVLRDEFHKSCKDLGIKGEKINVELVEILSELPGIYTGVAKKVSALDKVVEFYTSFFVYFGGKEPPGGMLRLLKFMIEHGNTTTYEWTYGEAPLQIEEPPLDVTINDKSNETAENIDFGDGIDFGDDVVEDSGVTLETGEIDWGEIGTDNTNIENGGEEIDFNISLEECNIKVESTGIEGGIARGREALTLLDNPTTRSRFMDEIMELQAFLKVRLLEMNIQSDLLTISQMQDAPQIIQLQSVENVKAMLKQVEDIINVLMNKRTQHLQNIKTSSRYVDFLTNSLKQRITAAEKMKNSAANVRIKRKELYDMATELEPKVTIIVSKTKELQAQLQSEISKKYKGRPVNIMGGVNFI